MQLEALNKEQRIARIQKAIDTKYWFMSLKFDATLPGASGNVPTQIIDRPLRAIGGFTDANYLRLQLQTSDGQFLTQGDVSIRALYNQKGLQAPFTPFRTAIELPAGTALNHKFVNNFPPYDNAIISVIYLLEESGLDYSPGNMEHLTTLGKTWVNDGRTSFPFTVPMNVPFTGVVGERVLNVLTAPADRPLLCLGLASEITNAHVQFSNGWNREVWSYEEIPIWAMSGDTKTAYTANFLFPKAIYIPPNGQIYSNWTNTTGEAAGKVNFLCITP